MKKALVTGITGQMGRYLTLELLDNDIEVHGIVRYSSKPNNLVNLKSFKHLFGEKVFLYYADMTDASSLESAYRRVNPDYVFNMAAQSHVAHSFTKPVVTGNVNGLGTARLLEITRKADKEVVFIQASTSELYGSGNQYKAKAIRDFKISERNGFNPSSPYAISKLYAYYMVKNYRESYGLLANNAIMFNFESPHRGEEFVTQKIIRGVVEIMSKNQSHIELGNLDTSRDWTYAGDTAEALVSLAILKQSSDFNICSGTNTTLREFIRKAFQFYGETIVFEGEGLNEVGILESSGQVVIKINPVFYRPVDVNWLCGDNSRIKKAIGWRPKHTIDDIIEKMILAV